MNIKRQGINSKEYYSYRLCIEKTKWMANAICSTAEKNSVLQSGYNHFIFQFFKKLKKKNQNLSNLNCQSNFVIYWMECSICKVKRVDNAKISCNTRLNNRRLDVYNANVIRHAAILYKIGILSLFTQNSH